MASVERPYTALDPNDPYEDIQGEVPLDEVPRRFSIYTGVMRTVKEYKHELRKPEIRKIVDDIHERGYVVAAKHRASEIVFDVAKHRRAIIAGSLTAAGAAAGYHFFRRRRKSG